MIHSTLYIPDHIYDNSKLKLPVCYVIPYLLWEAIVGKGEIQFWLGGKVGDTFNIHHLKTMDDRSNAILDF